MSIYRYGRTVAEFVRRFRLEQDLSQLELGKRMGLKSHQYISNVERGVDICPISFCNRLAPLLDEDRLVYLVDLIADASASRVSHGVMIRKKRNNVNLSRPRDKTKCDSKA